MINKLKQKLYNFLRWSEKWTKTDMIYLASGSFWFMLSTIITSIAALIIAWAFANFLSKETYGLYKYTLSIIGILSIFSLPGINTALTRSISRGFEGSLKLAIKTKIKWGALGSLIGSFVFLYYYQNQNYELAICILLSILLMPLTNTFNLTNSLIRGKTLFKYEPIFNFFTSIIKTTVTVSIIIFSKNIYLIIVAIPSIEIITSFVNYRIVQRVLKPNNKIDYSIIEYGKHLTAIKIISVIASNVDKIILWHTLGASGLSIYMFAIAPINQLKGPIKNISSLAFIKLSRKKTIVASNDIISKTLKASFFTLPIIIFYILIAPILYNLFFSQYAESIFYSQIYIITLLFLPAGIIEANFNATKNKKSLYILSFFLPITRISLFITLIPTLGILGLILSEVFSSLIGYILSIILLKKVTRENFTY